MPTDASISSPGIEFKKEKENDQHNEEKGKPVESPSPILSIDREEVEWNAVVEIDHKRGLWIIGWEHKVWMHPRLACL